jgi:hypothetical protein
MNKIHKRTKKLLKTKNNIDILSKPNKKVMFNSSDPALYENKY